MSRASVGVEDRYFDVQEDDAGRSCLWVRLEVATVTSASRMCQVPHERSCSFSDN